MDAYEKRIRRLEIQVQKLDRQMAELTRLLRHVENDRVQHAARRAQNA